MFTPARAWARWLLEQCMHVEGRPPHVRCLFGPQSQGRHGRHVGEEVQLVGVGGRQRVWDGGVAWHSMGSVCHQQHSARMAGTKASWGPLRWCEESSTLAPRTLFHHTGPGLVQLLLREGALHLVVMRHCDVVRRDAKHPALANTPTHAPQGHAPAYCREKPPRILRAIICAPTAPAPAMLRPP
jgi:hypothetical protein